MNISFKFFILSISIFSFIWSDNQTPDFSPIVPRADVPFIVKIEPADFSLPSQGFHSGVEAIYDGKWLLMCGRNNGLHPFFDPNIVPNFPKQMQNALVFVIDPKTGEHWMRDLNDSESGLNMEEIDSLSMTSPQSYQKGNTLYITGGYGVKRGDKPFNDKFITWDRLTAIDIPGLMAWTMDKSHKQKAKCYIRQISDPGFKVTGGYMNQIKSNDPCNPNPTLLICGQLFDGSYEDDPHNVVQEYTMTVRAFHIIDKGPQKKLRVKWLPPVEKQDFLRRRDLNCVPILQIKDGKPESSFIAYSGVFTESFGVFTVPVTIFPDGSFFQPDKDDPNTFKQGMNHYISATMGLFSEKLGKMYTVLFGGISDGFFVGGDFHKVNDLPFIDQVTAIELNENDQFSQIYLNNTTFPTIPTLNGAPGIFGTSAQFFPANPEVGLDQVFDLDDILDKQEETLVGYIVGGIVSTVPQTANNNQLVTTAASPCIFSVYVSPISND